jgi:sugar O-acyltransferase (sialic acid O-acetyltransferase NeuD family)
MSAIIVVGSGGFGREIFELVHALQRAGSGGWEVEGYVDDAPMPGTAELLRRMGTQLLGSVDHLLNRDERVAVVLAVGSPRARLALATRLTPADHLYPVLVHPDATVGRDVQLGAGTIVCAGARLSTHIGVAEHVHVDQNATIGHDSTIDPFTRLNPQACISGSVRLGARVLIGANATVLQGLQVGDDATVGAGAVVTRTVPIGSTVKGVPAR